MNKLLYTLSILSFCILTDTIKAQAPNISYSGVTADYPINTAITPLTPTNSGGAVTGTFAAVTTFAGSGTAGSTDATGTAASFSKPSYLVFDASDNLYVTDNTNHKIRKITSAGVVTTFAGGAAGPFDGTGTTARFNGPNGITHDASGNFYVADASNHKIRKMTSAGVVTTFAGTGSPGTADGTGTAAGFFQPSGIAIDASGNLYVAELYANRIRKITPAAVVTTFAGSLAFAAGSTDGTGTAATFNGPTSIAIDASDNLYVAENGGNKIRKITSAGVVTTLAGSGVAGSTDGIGTAATFNAPAGIAVDALGNVYVTESGGNKIRKITSAGVVTTIAGSGTSGAIDGVGTAASFNNPLGLVVDGSGHLYVAGYSGNNIRKVSLLGYSVSPNLPTGLSINPITGVISGTPTVAAASTTYTITGTNATGSSLKAITFAVTASLPVELLDFRATPSVSGNVLTWTTANEVNNKGFQVERFKTTGDSWDVLGFKTANNKSSTYDFTDNTPLSTSYYRLRQFDNDGKETLSKTISVEHKSNNKLKVYPNPVSNVLTVERNAVPLTTSDFQILNLLGQQVLNGKATQRIDVSALPEGTYFLKIDAEEVKFIKQ